LPPEEYKKEDGVRFANEYSSLKEKESQLAKEIENVSAKIITLRRADEGRPALWLRLEITIWKKQCVKFPGKQDFGYPELVKAPSRGGAWDEFSTLTSGS